MDGTGALGEIIRERRLAQGLTQDDLGTLAGYGRGAAVSISRIEHGLTVPSEDRFAGIAVALRTTPSELETAATDRTAKLSNGQAAAVAASAGRESLADRAKRAGQEITRREKLLENLASEFDDAVNRAWDGFLSPLIAVASRIEGAPPIADKPGRRDLTDNKAEATFRRRFAVRGVSHVFAGTVPALAMSMAPSAGRAAKQAAFKTAVAVGAASTGKPISELHGIAQVKATQALIGGGPLAKGGSGIAGGVRRLNGVQLAATALVAITPPVVGALRSVKKQRELAARLDELEAGLDASRPGFEGAADLLPVATHVLTKIAIHGAHGLKKWAMHIGEGAVRWESLDKANKQRYQDFVEIAGCQLAVEAIDFSELGESRNSDERDELLELAYTVLTESEDVVDRLA